MADGTSPTYATLAAQMQAAESELAAVELPLITAVQTAYTNLQAAITAAQAALSPAMPSRPSQKLLTDAMNNTASMLQQTNMVVTSLTPAQAVAAPPTS